MNTHSASEKILFDFQAATNSAAWQIVNDDVMGGVSTSAFRLTTNSTVLFTGRVSLENNGGFASVRSVPAQHDLGGCDSLVVRVRAETGQKRVRPEIGPASKLIQSGCGCRAVCHLRPRPHTLRVGYPSAAYRTASSPLPSGLFVT